ncbi:lysophospholipase [bacterium]|nr:lysophospholipase [bacterium]
MQSGTFNFTASDNLSLFGRVWQSELTPVKGVVNLVHGLGEHSGRYAHIAEALTKAGYHFIAFDLRGHGLSKGKRGHTPNYDQLLDDVSLFLEKSKQIVNADLPNFLYGHSLGGGIVINYGLRRENTLKGVIATDPALELAFKPSGVKLWLGRLMANLAPKFSLDNELETDALSRDAAIVKAYTDDALVHRRISAKLVTELLDSGEYALEHAADWDMPLLLMHGTADRISSGEASRVFAENAKSGVTLRLWDGYYHEIHNDIGKADVIAAMIDWLDIQIG